MGRVDWNTRLLQLWRKERGLFPYGKSGLKSCFLGWVYGALRSLPVWEEWIEIALRRRKPDHHVVSSRMGRVDWNPNEKTHPSFLPVSSRMGRVDWNGEYEITVSAVAGLFPYGKSGLKFFGGHCGGDGPRSLPVWEEWIEMFPASQMCTQSPSLPVWEEWIEMWKCYCANHRRMGLFPYGKSGLKFITAIKRNARKRLFPYGKSGLKWLWNIVLLVKLLSLPVWEEWIEMCRTKAANGQAHVSSRMGRVDWNSCQRFNVCPAPRLFPYGKSGLK